MVMNRLVWACFIQGTSFADGGPGIRIEPQAGEKILFFKTDGDECRRLLAMAINDAICDALVFYRLDLNRPIFLFVELKGSDVLHAVEQIESTAAAVRKWLPAGLARPIERGLVVSSGSAPRGGSAAIKTKTVPIQFKSGVRKANIDIRGYLN
jgi:hypothetical protein